MWQKCHSVVVMCIILYVPQLCGFEEQIISPSVIGAAVLYCIFADSGLQTQSWLFVVSCCVLSYAGRSLIQFTKSRNVNDPTGTYRRHVFSQLPQPTHSLLTSTAPPPPRTTTMSAYCSFQLSSLLLNTCLFLIIYSWLFIGYQLPAESN